MNPECAKCGARMIGPQLWRARNVERLRYVCTCGYVTTRPTRDAKNAQAENELRVGVRSPADTENENTFGVGGRSTQEHPEET